MVSAHDFFHTPIFSFGIILLIYSLLISFGVLVNVLASGIWGEASDAAATVRKSKFNAWLKRITFYEILIGMKTTLTHLLHYHPVTQQYPYDKPVLPENYRGMLALLRYDDGTEKCVGCDLCEAACPSRVISVISAEVPGEPTKRYAREYYMDMTRCLFCGMCVQACPVDALGMTREYEWSVSDKRDLLLNKQQLLALGDRSFPTREKRLEFQHLNVAVFNVAFHNHPPKQFWNST
jgi:NADH-quinone oxidoreductase subunit I